MKTLIPSFEKMKGVVQFFYKQLKLDKHEKHKGRKLAIPIVESISLGLFKQLYNITTKKAIFKIFKPKCSYKTLVVNLNKFAMLALLVLTSILKDNRRNSHLVKHTDSTEIPVCLKKNGKYHKTMKEIAKWGNTGKGSFFGLKMHLSTDLKRRMLAVKFTSGNIHDKEVFLELNKDLYGIFIADAAYVSKKLEKTFNIEGKRILLAKPRKNMKKLITEMDFYLYKTRMLIELNFRNLKMFHGLVTSPPRSVNGYLANYIYSLLAYIIA